MKAHLKNNTHAQLTTLEDQLQECTRTQVGLAIFKEINCNSSQFNNDYLFPVIFIIGTVTLNSSSMGNIRNSCCY